MSLCFLDQQISGSFSSSSLTTITTTSDEKQAKSPPKPKPRKSQLERTDSEEGGKGIQSSAEIVHA